MKKTLACLLLGMLLFPVLAGCSATGESDEPTMQEESSGGQPEGQPEEEPGIQANEQPPVSEEEREEDMQHESTDPQPRYVNITPEEAKQLMDGDQPYVIVDVREDYEYAEGHIPGAVLLPLGSIDEQSAAAVLPDRNVMLLVYCRSGRRSKQASEILLELGYTDIREFGGIIDWPYETER